MSISRGIENSFYCYLRITILRVFSYNQCIIANCKQPLIKEEKAASKAISELQQINDDDKWLEAVTKLNKDSEQIYSDCTTTLKQEFGFIPPKQGVDQKFYSWQNISWLKEKLGEPNISTLQETVYKWPNYSLLLRADKPIESLNTHPASDRVETRIPPSLDRPMGSGVPSAKAVSQVLGKPTSIENFPITQYEWLCTESNQRARLTILTDSSNEILRADSMYCTPDCISSNLDNLSQSPGQKALVPRRS